MAGSDLEEDTVLSLETRLYTPSEAAQRLGVTPERVRQLLRAGRIPHVQTPLGRLIDANALDAIAQARAAQSRPVGRRGETR